MLMKLGWDEIGWQQERSRIQQQNQKPRPDGFKHNIFGTIKGAHQMGQLTIELEPKQC